MGVLHAASCLAVAALLFAPGSVAVRRAPAPSRTIFSRAFFSGKDTKTSEKTASGRKASGKRALDRGITTDWANATETCCCSEAAMSADGLFVEGVCNAQGTCAAGEVTGHFVQPWLDRGADPQDGALKEPKALFFDFDSTLNPGQNGNPLTEARAMMLHGFFAKWKAENPGVKIFILTAADAAIKRQALEEAKIMHLFDDVFQSSAKAPWLSKWIRKNPGFSAKTTFFMDDNPEIMQKVFEEDFGGSPPCHTFRLPYRGQGLNANDLSFVRDAFLRRRWGPTNATLMHVNVVYFQSARAIDPEDSAVKTIFDGLAKPQLVEILQANLVSGSGGGPSEYFHSWVRGRPDYCHLVNASEEQCGIMWGATPLDDSQSSTVRTAPVCGAKTKIHLVKDSSKHCLPRPQGLDGANFLVCPAGADMYCLHKDPTERCCCSNELGAVQEKVIIAVPGIGAKKKKQATTECGAFRCRCPACGESYKDGIAT